MLHVGVVWSVAVVGRAPTAPEGGPLRLGARCYYREQRSHLGPQSVAGTDGRFSRTGPGSHPPAYWCHVPDSARYTTSGSVGPQVRPQPLARVHSAGVIPGASRDSRTLENFFVSVHTVFVRVRRGGKNRGQEDLDGWRSLNSHLMVRDTREQDPEAELMVSAMMPSFALMMAPPAFTELQLRPRDGIEMYQAPKSVMRRLGGYFNKHFFKATLDNADKTAVLIPGATGDILHGGVSRPRFLCPDRVACPDQYSLRPSPPVGRGLSKAVDTHRFMHGDAAIDQAVELVEQAGSNSGDARLVYRVTLVMANDEARECLAAGGAPAFETSHDPCSVRVALGEGLSHATGLPFPIEQRRVQMEYSKRQGHVIYTVPPVRQPLNLPLAWSSTSKE
ncbi:unnamed protein product [Ectocarpus sp. 12 AP-2014]